MNYKQLTIESSYISKGDNNIADSFLNPVLRYTKEYKRSVGFFSSSVLEITMNGIMELAKNGGKFKLIVSPQLSEEDFQAIKLGYDRRNKIITENFSLQFNEEIDILSNNSLQMLCDLIEKNILDIKIAITNNNGIYHDKLGILKDFFGNTLVFYGSANSTYCGYRNNYEKIRIAKSWESGFNEIVEEEEKEFDMLWENKNPYVEVYDYTVVAKNNIINIISKRKSKKGNEIILRDYQEEAIKSWVNNDYKGFYIMATGTGKTWTAIFSAKKLLEKFSAMIVIVAPYKHLIKQWAEDIKKVFDNAIIILVSSENKDWSDEIINAIVKSNYDEGKQIIIISTIKSFYIDKFDKSINKYKGDKLLIVDEAHRFTKRDEILITKYKYMLGLSATPFSGKTEIKGKELMEFFGGQVFSLPIEEALKRGFLVPYKYNPIIVSATEDEEENFKKYSKIITTCFKNGKCINKDLFTRIYKKRLRLISMSQEKQNNLNNIIKSIYEKDHFIVYCGDGHLFDDDTGNEVRHIESVQKILSKNGYKSSRFTAKENIDERMKLVEHFNTGDISVLTAIRCLDEGINIPSIKSALILSSNDDYREFVQRRGRILRLYEGKEKAIIYDVIALPSRQLSKWAEIELRRYYEYAKLAENWENLKEEFFGILSSYSLTLEDVDIYNYNEMESDIYEE